ncbi:MAG: aminotransferase class I/II-fold pyridoxal phosphate-dependent enzyme [Rhodobacteraceae bacterium]|nr:aminotransferase class I/II-fold pyridoxal phosphate-dependent enzyme [Paracoccaceae bacterium]
MPKLANRITASAPKNFGMFARALGVPGDLIHLELGMPAADTPAHIKEATIQALRDGHVHYSDLRGIEPLRAALAKKLRDQNGLDVSADDILVTNGLTQASFAAFIALLDPGDECILPEPYYPQHLGKIELAGAVPVLAPLTGPDFRLTRAALDPHITERTKMISIVNPCNPTGRVYSREELQAVADLAIKHDLWVISDEVYEHITYGPPHISIAALTGMAKRTVTMSAFTKAYAMDGWRIGYLAAHPDVMPALMKITTNEVTHVNTFIQYGAVAALEGPPEALAGMVAKDRACRDLVVARLNQMPGVTCAEPDGTIYAWPDISATGMAAQELAEKMMHEVGVVVEAGSFYGAAGEGHLRVCFGAQPMDSLAEAMGRMQRFFNGL